MVWYIFFHLSPRRTRRGVLMVKILLILSLADKYYILSVDDDDCSLLRWFLQSQQTKKHCILSHSSCHLSTFLHKSHSTWNFCRPVVKDDRGMKWRQHQSNKPPPWQPFDRGEICISVWPPNFNCKVLSTSTQLQRYTECLFVMFVFLLILSNRWHTQAAMLFSWGLSDSDGIILIFTQFGNSSLSHINE